MALELYNRDGHVCLAYTDLVTGDMEAVQANQFLVVDNGHCAVIDPGGNMTYHSLYMAMSQYVPARKLDMILASHADPDIVASLNKWLVGTDATLYISSVWSRFVPHFCSVGNTEGRVVGIADPGGRIALGRSHLVALPAHFLHAEGNFQFHDPVAKILFSGDLGTSLVSGEEASRPVTDFARHIPRMEPFHRRYMAAGKVCRLWAQMARGLDIEWIVPQHGRPMQGKVVVKAFIDWIETLSCGIDLMTAENYRVPSGWITREAVPA